MSASKLDIQRYLSTEFGLSSDVKQGSKHPMLIFVWNGRTHKLPIHNERQARGFGKASRVNGFQIDRQNVNRIIRS